MGSKKKKTPSPLPSPLLHILINLATATSLFARAQAVDVKESSSSHGVLNVASLIETNHKHDPKAEAAHHRSAVSGGTGTGMSVWAQVRAGVHEPPQCDSLVMQHGSHIISEWLKLREVARGHNLTIEDAGAECTRATECKGFLDPIVTWSQKGGGGGGALASVAKSCLNQCSQNGICIDGACNCLPQFTGEDCSVDRCGNNCTGHGMCRNGQCFCDPGYTGDKCQTKIECKNDCSGHGTCTHGKCFCDPGRTGPFCSEREVCPGTPECSDHGICHEGRCLCTPEWGNVDCSAALEYQAPTLLSRCLNNCSYHGTCDHGTCHCALGYSGADCSIQASCPETYDNRTGTKKVCAGHGICKFFKCHCDPGYKGTACDVKIPCPQDCNHRGICKYGRCYCNPGFSGLSCAATGSGSGGSSLSAEGAMINIAEEEGSEDSSSSKSSSSSSSSSKSSSSSDDNTSNGGSTIPSWAIYISIAILSAVIFGSMGFCLSERNRKLDKKTRPAAGSAVGPPGYGVGYSSGAMARGSGGGSISIGAMRSGSATQALLDQTA